VIILVLRTMIPLKLQILKLFSCQPGTINTWTRTIAMLYLIHDYFAFTLMTMASSVLSFTKFCNIDLGCRPNSLGGYQERLRTDEPRIINVNLDLCCRPTDTTHNRRKMNQPKPSEFTWWWFDIAACRYNIVLCWCKIVI